MASFSWQLGAHPLSSCSHSVTADNDNNNHNGKRHDSLVHFVRSLHCIRPPLPSRPSFPSQARIGRSTINLFLNPLLNVCRFPEGALPSLGLFTPTPFFPSFSPSLVRVEKAARLLGAFVGCRRLTHCRRFGNKPGRLAPPGCFSHTPRSLPNTHPVQIRLHSD